MVFNGVLTTRVRLVVKCGLISSESVREIEYNICINGACNGSCRRCGVVCEFVREKDDIVLL